MHQDAKGRETTDEIRSQGCAAKNETAGEVNAEKLDGPPTSLLREPLSCDRVTRQARAVLDSADQQLRLAYSVQGLRLNGVSCRYRAGIGPRDVHCGDPLTDDSAVRGVRGLHSFANADN